MRRAALVLIAWTGACGPGSYREFREQLVDASCTLGVRCGAVDPTDRARCPVDRVLALFHDALADHAQPGALDLPASISAGRMRYDSVNAQGCLDAVSGAPCEPTLAGRFIQRACNAVVGAHTETDRPCWGDAECTGGICARAPGCAGICAAYASYGDPCVDSDLAAASARCDPSVAFCAPPTPGADPICQQKKPEGAACADTRECDFDWTCRLGTCTDPIELDENQACGGTDPCKRDTYCDPITRLCQRRHAQAEACDADGACTDRLACQGLVVDDSGAFVSAGACAPWLVVGAACSQPTQTTVSGCPGSAPCLGGVCTASAPLAGRGEDCSQRTCAPGLACDVQRRCDFLAEIFGDCRGDRGSSCDPALTCTPTSSTTFAPGACVPVDAPACFFPVQN